MLNGKPNGKSSIEQISEAYGAQAVVISVDAVDDKVVVDGVIIVAV